jgi:hypothetical protein
VQGDGLVEERVVEQRMPQVFVVLVAAEDEDDLAGFEIESARLDAGLAAVDIERDRLLRGLALLDEPPERRPPPRALSASH